MNFTERQLQELYFASCQPEYFEGKRTSPGNCTLEFVLPSGNRVDILSYKKNFRIFDVYECKIVAEPRAILQAWEYREEIYNRLVPSGSAAFSTGFITIAAQFFKSDTLAFAKLLGIRCVQISPINYEDATITTIQDSDRQMQMKQIEPWHARNVFKFRMGV